MTALRKFILTADVHLVGEAPVARQDTDWLETQRQALRFLCDTAMSRNVPLVVVGDIFDKPRVATEVVNMAIAEFKRISALGQGVYFIAGNHDLIGNNADSIPQCSIGTVLSIFPAIPQIDGIQDAQHFGRDMDTGAKVKFTHQLVFKDKSSRPPMAKGKTAKDLLDECPNADWIFVGDLHHCYHVEIDGRHVVSTGNVVAHNASMIEVDANCAYIDLDSETVEWIKIPDDPAMLTREHLDKVEERESRLEAFLEKAKEAGGVELTFAGKLEARMGLEDITQGVHAAYVAVKERATKGEP